MEYSPVMLDKVTKLDEPLHQPMKDQALSHFDTYKRPLFPVQAHVATGAAKSITSTKRNHYTGGKCRPAKVQL